MIKGEDDITMTEVRSEPSVVCTARGVVTGRPSVDCINDGFCVESKIATGLAGVEDVMTTGRDITSEVDGGIVTGEGAID